MSRFYHVIVIGAGPAGMMAAITAAKNRKRVLIIEHNDKVGKKIYATGNGKCNFTNENMEINCFHGDATLIENTLSMFSERDLIHSLHEMGILPKSKNGYLYPNSEQASSVVYALEKELAVLGVDVLIQSSVSYMEQRKGDWYLSVGKEEYRANSIIIATGLLASPKLGSDGSFIDNIKNLGHSFNKIVPALCGFHCDGIDFKKASGVRQEGLISLWIDDDFVEQDYGEIQFADYGLSGIPVFQVSSNASKALSQKRKVEIGINFMPYFDREELVSEIKYRSLMLSEEATIRDVWNGLLNDKLCNPLLEQVSLNDSVLIKDISDKNYDDIADALTYTRVSVLKSRGFDVAQVCAGGVKTEEIDVRTLESKLVPNLFFAGEILDVDGICGGYNLQWAFSSGYVAGEFASR